VVATLLVVAVTAVAVAPGLLWYSSWARHATYTMPAAEASLADAVPDGQRVAGTESAIFLLRSHAITLLTQRVGGVANDGNLYAMLSKAILRLPPTTLEPEKLADSPVAISAGGAIFPSRSRASTRIARLAASWYSYGAC